MSIFAWLFSKNTEATETPETWPGVPYALPVENVVEQTPIAKWQTPLAGLKYENLFVSASEQYGVPAGLLSCMAWKESRYNPTAKSPVGAYGLMQFMPATAAWLNVDAADPASAIYGAGKYIASLKNQTGSWSMALAAYNWGIGNLTRLGFSAAPAETRDYVADITNKTGVV